MAYHDWKDFYIFSNELDSFLKKLFSVTIDFIICGDININFLINSDRKRQLETLLKTYHSTSVVNFPTHTQQNSASALDNFLLILLCLVSTPQLL
jgi:hypothetical protein